MLCSSPLLLCFCTNTRGGISVHVVPSCTSIQSCMCDTTVLYHHYPATLSCFDSLGMSHAASPASPASPQPHHTKCKRGCWSFFPNSTSFPSSSVFNSNTPLHTNTAAPNSTPLAACLPPATPCDNRPAPNGCTAL